MDKHEKLQKAEKGVMKAKRAEKMAQEEYNYAKRTVAEAPHEPTEKQKQVWARFQQLAGRAKVLYTQRGGESITTWKECMTQARDDVLQAERLTLEQQQSMEHGPSLMQEMEKSE